MAGPVRKRRQASVFTPDQHEDLRWALGSQYEELLPILEKIVAGHKANRPSLDDMNRAHTKTAKNLAALCRRFLRDLKRVTPPWREVQQWEFGPPLTSAEVDERMLALNKSRSAVESLLEQTRVWEEIGSRLRRRKPGKQTENRLLLAKYVGLLMIAAGIRLTQHANVKNLPDGYATTQGGPFATTLQVVYAAAVEPVVDLYPDVATVTKALKGVPRDVRFRQGLQRWLLVLPVSLQP